MELLRTGQVASEFCVSPTTVRRWIKSGKLRAVKIERFWFVRRADCELLINGGANE